MNSKDRRLIQASIVGDASGLHAPGVVLLEGRSVLASGSPEAVGAPGPEVQVENLDGHLVCPPLVNAHVHLDLTDLAPLPDGRDFDRWLGAVIDHRRTQDRPGAVEAAVEEGVRASLAGGCPFVGDISGTMRSFEALASSGLSGVGYLELFGHGDRLVDALSLLEQMTARVGRTGPGSRIRPGISPHAPYSAGLELFEAAAAAGLPVATHLAESPEELEWCRTGTGPFARRLTQMGYDSGAVAFPGRHPLDVYPSVLARRGALIAHANYSSPEHLEGLRVDRSTVVYCPRAYRYFGHPHGGCPPHAWRAMRAAGVSVALGTDGRPCLPASGAAARRLSVLDEAACLQDQEGASIEEWLPMATIEGARGLGVPDEEVLLGPGPKAALPAIPLRPGGDREIDPEGVILDLLGSG